MSHLNYFKPYISKSSWLEDQLTRAFLVVLRYSPITLFSFYDYIRSSIWNNDRKKNIKVSLPEVSAINMSNIRMATQTSDIERP